MISISPLETLLIYADYLIIYVTLAFWIMITEKFLLLDTVKLPSVLHFSFTIH